MTGSVLSIAPIHCYGPDGAATPISIYIVNSTYRLCHRRNAEKYEVLWPHFIFRQIGDNGLIINNRPWRPTSTAAPIRARGKRPAQAPLLRDNVVTPSP